MSTAELTRQKARAAETLELPVATLRPGHRVVTLGFFVILKILHVALKAYSGSFSSCNRCNLRLELSKLIKCQSGGWHRTWTSSLGPAIGQKHLWITHAPDPGLSPEA